MRFIGAVYKIAACDHRNGSSLHATDSDKGVSFSSKAGGSLHILSLDAPLVAVGTVGEQLNLWHSPTQHEAATAGQGVGFNLFNNLWNTNYVYWYPWRNATAEEDDGTTTFRWSMRLVADGRHSRIAKSDDETGLTPPPPPSPLPETDWLSAAGHGVFTHFLYKLQNDFGSNSLGQNSTWDECVAQFDVESYAADVAATGAKFAFITMMQVEKYMIAPNAVFDTLTGYLPGEACAKRDLVLDLSAALEKRALKLGLYWTGNGPCGDPQGTKGMGDDGTPFGSNVEFVKRWTSVLQEYAERYGDKVFGWWIDGCYFNAGGYGYTDDTLKYYHDAIRAGNPQAVIGFNNVSSQAICRCL